MGLPKSWSEVTINQYLNIYKIILAKDLEPIDRQAMVLSELLCKPLQAVYDMPIEDFKHAVAKTSFIYDNNISEKIPTIIEIDGIEYFFDPIRPIKKAGEFIDISHLTKDKDDTIYNLHKVMAVLCKPKKVQDYNERCEIFLHKMTMDKCYPLSVFFLNVSIKSAPIIEAYLEKQVQKGMKEMAKIVEEEMGKKLSMNIGDGMQPLTR